MKTYFITSHIIIFFLLLLANGSLFAQVQPSIQNEQLTAIKFTDSLTQKDSKTNNGYYLKQFPLKHEAGGRLIINYFAYQKNKESLSLSIFNSNTKKSVNYFSEVIAGVKTATIHLDTVFAKADTENIIFITDKPGGFLNFTAFVFYAPPQLLTFSKNETFCKKLFFLLQHSANGFQFIKKENKISSSEWETTVPFIPESPLLSSIHKNLDSFWDLCYKSKIAGGKKDQMSVMFNQLSLSIRSCFGDFFTYKETKDEKGLSMLVATAISDIAENSVINGQYSFSKNKREPQYIVTIKMIEEKIQGEQVYTLNLEIKNLFYNP